MNRILFFALGAAIGSLATWKLVEEKYKKIANEEIESVIRQFKIREDKINEQNSKNFTPSTPYESCNPEEHKEYKDLVDELGYINEEEDYPAPFIISPEEYGELEGYSIESLIYYTDGVVADDTDKILDDPEIVLGDALDHFGEFEDDAVHVRNIRRQCDYEVLKSEKQFSDLIKEDN